MEDYARRDDEFLPKKKKEKEQLHGIRFVPEGILNEGEPANNLMM